MQEPRPFLIGGQWRHGETLVSVNNPFTGKLLAEVSNASSADAEAAIQSTVDAAVAMKTLPSHARYHALQKIAGGIYDRRDEFARLMTAEAGKPSTDAKREVNRAVQTFTIAAEEAKRIPGEVILSTGRRGRIPISAFSVGFPSVRCSESPLSIFP